MKKILLTGGNGFIGKNILHQLQDTYTIYAPSRMELDLLDADAVLSYLEEHPVDVVVHAANIGGNRNQKNILRVEEHNLQIFNNIIAAKKYFSCLIMLGSGAEYDKRNSIMLAKEEEAKAAMPVDPYGAYKKKCSEFASTVDYITHLRLFGVFGPHEDCRIRFISNNICRALLGMPMSLSKNVKFDYLYIDDFVNILRWFIEQDRLKYTHYNVCTGKSIDLLSIANIIKDVSGKNLEIQIGESGMGKEYSGSNDRLMAEMGGFTFTSIEESVKKLYKWYERNLNAIDKESLLFDS